jgi:glutathionylspermidine synthase
VLREPSTPRQDWPQKVEKLGLTFHTVDDQPYWFESAAYRFDASEIAAVESATNELQRLCLLAVERIVQRRDFERFAIPRAAWDVIVKAWDADPPAIYGRFDLAYAGHGAPKLLEYNADTPTSLLEAAVVQWHWLQEVHPSSDQFNSIWEGLVEKWRSLKDEGYFPDGLIQFACGDSREDLMTVAVLMDAACEAGLQVNPMLMDEIGWDVERGRFVDQRNRPIRTIFKLYPWEWMLTDPFGGMALKDYESVQWIEPIWKMILSNKAILAVLWEMFPGHPNLLAAFQDGPHDMEAYVRKPILGREGANVTIHRVEGTVSNDGPYGDIPVVYQALAELPNLDGVYPVIGSWVVDCEARGMGVRESDTPITGDLARFVPHYFEPHPTP